MKRRLLLATLLVPALFLCTIQSCLAAPPLWVVQSATAKIYLFGTVHILGDKVQWRSPELEAAIAESQDLYLEIADANNSSEAVTALFKLGVDRDHPLSSELPKNDIALLDEQARKYGMPGEAIFEPMRPWFAYMMLSVLPALHSASGTGSNGGVDLQIRKQFADAGKPIRGFETFDGQAHLLADLPQATQIALLESALRAPQSNQSSAFDSIVEAWRSGDADALARVLQLDAMEKTPIYAPMIGDRNAAWAAALAQRLKQPGVSFVAVGAAHLVGHNGVPVLLQHMGFNVARVQIADVSPVPSASAVLSPAPSPTASASPPPPPKFTPPDGWNQRAMPLQSAGFSIDNLWADPRGDGIIVTGHLAMAAGALPNLDAVDVFFHQGLVAIAGADAVQPSKHVKVCGGKQEGLYTTVTIGAAQEDIVLVMSDHVYLAQYVRRAAGDDDPAALKSLFTLCAP
ncbi:MAG: TraB/GumN family protein [Candidatus Aquilonibacter sp.]